MMKARIRSSSPGQRGLRRRRRTAGSGMITTPSSLPNLLPSLLVLLLLLLVVGPSAGSRESSSSNDPSLSRPFQSSFEHLPHSACVTLFHRNGRVGCGTSSHDPTTGRLLRFSSSLSTPNNDLKIAVVFTEAEFTSSNVQSVQNALSDALVGVLVANTTESLSGDSVRCIYGSDSSSSYESPAAPTVQGDDTPSANVAYGGSYNWNSDGNSLELSDLFGVPTALVTDREVSSYLLDMSSKQVSELNSADGQDAAAVVAEFNYYMGPYDATAESCLSWIDTDEVWRPKGLPLGGQSVWAVAGSPEVSDGNRRGRRRLEDAGGNDNADDGDADADGNDADAADADNGAREIVMVTSAMDSTSVFHESTPASNGVVSNLLALLMAAKSVGSIPDSTLDVLNKRVAFGIFQGDSYGYMGSRSFLLDAYYGNFQCENMVKADASSSTEEKPYGNRTFEKNEDACLYPLRPSLAFSKLGAISSMISVDQVGVLSTDKTLYVHGEGADSNGAGEFLGNVLKQLSGDYAVASSGAEAGDDGAVPVPPSPLTSLLKLSGGTVGGVVLSGYDDAYVADGTYRSHLDSPYLREIDLDAVAATATVIARGAVAAAYDDGSGDYETAAAYAANLVPEVNAGDETLASLAECLLRDAWCDYFKQYVDIERANEIKRTGLDLGAYTPRGGDVDPSIPNYYVSVLNEGQGQPFVQVGQHWYGSYDGDDYGKSRMDNFLMRPRALEAGLLGLLNDFLGRGSSSSSSDGGGRRDTEYVSCSSTADCGSVPYCSPSNGDRAVCSGGLVCVCSRAHYHLAMDGAIEAATNNSTGRFVVRDDDDGTSPLYVEPYWSSGVGVRVYREAGADAGKWAAVAGALVAAGSLGASFLVKVKMQKEKLY